MKLILNLSFRTIIMIFTPMILLSCDWDIIEKDQDNCLTEFTGFPDLAGWEVEEIEIPGFTSINPQPFFIDESTGYILSYKGSLLQTVDGGFHWDVIYEDTNSHFWTMSIVPPDHIFISALGDLGNYILKSNDGGDSWLRIMYTPARLMSEMFFIDSLYGLATLIMEENTAVNSNQLFRTIDGGKTWDEIPGIITNFLNPNPIHIFSEGFGYVAGNNGGIFITNDFGQTWTLRATSLDIISKVQFTDPYHGFAYNNGQLLKTSDGGIEWHVISDEQLLFFHFFTGDRGIKLQRVSWDRENGLFKECNAFAITENGGISWNQGSESRNFNVGRHFFVNDRLGFIMSANNPIRIYRLTRL